MIIELLLVLPLFAGAGLVFVQLLLVGLVDLESARASRIAADAASAGEEPEAAVRAELGRLGARTFRSVVEDGSRVTVTLRTPDVLPFGPPLVVDATWQSAVRPTQVPA